MQARTGNTTVGNAALQGWHNFSKCERNGARAKPFNEITKRLGIGPDLLSLEPCKVQFIFALIGAPQLLARERIEHQKLRIILLRNFAGNHGRVGLNRFPVLVEVLNNAGQVQAFEAGESAAAYEVTAWAAS